jgi:Icc-related predicted phosphoesterase
VKIVCISDTHLHHGITIPDGDVLVHAGDGSLRGEGTASWREWLASLPHPHKVTIAGNHDHPFQRESGFAVRHVPKGVVYLQDSGFELGGVRFWGAPWTLLSPGKDGAFYLPRDGSEVRDAWARVPEGTDVLVTHTPPFGVLDRSGWGEHLGCRALLRRVEGVRPRLHVFGHIHSDHGQAVRGRTRFVNATICDGERIPSNLPQVVVV